MSDALPPPAPPSCLTKPYASRPWQKGGTLIAEDVHDLEDHRRRLADPGGYRPRVCPTCGHFMMHAHDFRARMPRDRPRGSCVDVRRYRCPLEPCGACWQVLPAFLARHLQRAWDTIERATSGVGILRRREAEPRTPYGTRAPAVPERTLRRYAERLCACAAAVVAVLAGLVSGIEPVLARLGERPRRAELCEALVDGGFVAPGRRLEAVAGWIQRLAPGLRLM